MPWQAETVRFVSPSDTHTRFFATCRPDLLMHQNMRVTTTPYVMESRNRTGVLLLHEIPVVQNASRTLNADIKTVSCKQHLLSEVIQHMGSVPFTMPIPATAPHALGHCVGIRLSVASCSPNAMVRANVILVLRIHCPASMQCLAVASMSDILRQDLPNHVFLVHLMLVRPAPSIQNESGPCVCPRSASVNLRTTALTIRKAQISVTSVWQVAFHVSTTADGVVIQTHLVTVSSALLLRNCWSPVRV